jgi:cysteine synthase
MTDDTNIFGSVVNTPFVELKRVVPQGYARVFVKVEGHSPTGSMKEPGKKVVTLLCD